MKSLIIYYSAYHKNTEKIAKVFASKTNADLLSLKDTKKAEIDNYDLIGFGSGVYRESMSPQLLSFAEKLNLKNKDFFIFSTSGIGMRFYNNKLIKLLKSKGGRYRGSFACKGSFVSRDFSENRIFEILSKFAEDHPNDKDICRAEKFVGKIVAQGKV